MSLAHIGDLWLGLDSQEWKFRNDISLAKVQSRVILFLLSERSSEFLVINQIVGEGNGTPLQYSCLENPMDGGAW